MTLPFCLNTSIQRASYPKCEIFRAGECGHGLRVCSDVPNRTILIEYTGEVITTRECNDRMKGMRGDQYGDESQMISDVIFNGSLFGRLED